MALGSVLVGTTPAHAAVLVVTTTDDSGPGSLRAALAQAQATAADDQITFDPSVSGTILLTSGELDVVAGASSGNLTIEGPGPDALTVEAGGGGVRSRVLDVRGRPGDTRATVVVSGLTLTRGGAALGGAIRATTTDLTLDRVVVVDNVADEAGGGVYVDGGSLLVTASTIAGNTARQAGPGLGGGIYFDAAGAASAALEVRDSDLSVNTARNGGAVHSPGSGPVRVTRSTVSGNRAFSVVGRSTDPRLVGEGGGISAGDLTVVDSHITDNEAGQRGGGLVGRSVVVTRSTIVGNQAHRGGGIGTPEALGAGVEVRVESSTVTGNRADRGGGLYFGVGTSAEVTLSTVADNFAITGGGLYSNTDVALRGAIIAMNTDGDLAGDGSVSLDHSLIRDTRGLTYVDTGGSITGVDPLLAPLGDHGGPTETMPPASNSPAIDRGSAFGHTVDQRGSARPVDDAGTPDAVDGSDIGAVELTEAELGGLPRVGNIEPPRIPHTARTGDTLHADAGAWEPEDVSLSYQWLRGGVPIPGATAASYTLTSDDFGRSYHYPDILVRISVRVTASAVGHQEGSMVSNHIDRVGKGVMTTSRHPRVTGKLRAGSTLRAWPYERAVSPQPAGEYVRWFVDGRQVSGAKILELKPRMRGKRVRALFVFLPPTGYRTLSLVVKRTGRVR